MKTSLKKLQKLAAIKHDKRSRTKQQQNQQHLAEDELARATQDMNDMKDCYDRLLSAAAASANSVYELSESLREMGDCLLEKTALNDDEESGKVLLMLGKVQFELQKLVDGYRSHIFQTITIPSESLLNKLHIVEEMKKSCDEKRATYEDLMKKQREKGRLRNSKGECFQSPQLQEAQTEYDEEANMFVFRMKSLKQGQSRSFLTQASRHHAAQLYFFKKAVRSLEAVEPHVRSLAEHLHIDYQFSEIKHDGFCDDDDESDGDDDTEDGSETHDYRELSFDYRQTSPVQEVHTSKKIETEKADPMVSPYSKMDSSEAINFGRRSFSFQRGARAQSKSAPLFPDKKLDTTEQTGHLRPLPSRKFTSYVLPTPDEAKSPASGKIFNEVPQTRQSIPNLWHSSPLNQNKYEKLRAEEKLSGPIILDAQSVLKESNTTRPNPLSPQSVEGRSSDQLDPNLASYAKKARRQAFSGPLTRKPLPNALNFTASGPIVSSAFPLHFSGSLLHIPVPQPPSSPKISGVSPTTTSAPRISELHELPRPPAHVAVRRPVNRITHSGPIISRSRELSTTSVPKFTAASALPTPPQALSRSYSIPSGSSSEVALQSSLGSPQNSRMEEDVLSPPSPITLPNVQAASLHHR